MYELRIYPNFCNGLKSCGLCEEFLPGFLTEHNGKIMISDTVLKKKNDVIIDALAACPTGSLFLDEL